MLNRFAKESGVLNLGWLPVTYRRDLNLSKLVSNSLNHLRRPSYMYLKLERYARVKTLISSNERKLTVPIVNDTLQDCGAAILC